MFETLVTIRRVADRYSVAVFVAQQGVFFRTYAGRSARRAAIKHAQTQATLRKCGVASKFSLTRDEQIGLRLAGVALVNEERK